MKLYDLCREISIMVAQAADENGIGLTDADDWYDSIAEAVDLGLEGARDRP